MTLYAHAVLYIICVELYNEQDDHQLYEEADYVHDEETVEVENSS